MRKPREERRSTRSSVSCPRAAATQKKSTVAKVKAKMKPKPDKAQSKKQGKDVVRPMEVTVIRVRNPKTPKSILHGGVTKQKAHQKKKTAAVVGAIKEDLLKKLAENVDSEKLSGVVNTLLEVAVVKKVLPRKKNKSEENVRTPQEKHLKREQPVKQLSKVKKESAVDAKADLTAQKESEKKTSKDTEKKVASKEVKKLPAKEEKKLPLKEEKKLDKKSNSKTAERKLGKKTEKKMPTKETGKKVVVNQTKKLTRGSNAAQSEARKKPPTKPKSKAADATNSSGTKVSKNQNVEGSNKKDTDVKKKESEISKVEKEINRKESEGSKRLLDSGKKDGSQRKDVESSSKSIENIVKEEDSKKTKILRDEDTKKPTIAKDDVKKQSNTKDEIKKQKATKEPAKKTKKVVKKENGDKKTVNVKTGKKVNEKERNKSTHQKELKKTASRITSKSKGTSSKGVNKNKKKAPSKTNKAVKSELENSAKIDQILNAPKRHREASLNALAKVHCLYENESRGVIMDILDKSEKLAKDEKKERVSLRTVRESSKSNEDVEEVEEIPVRNLRTAPGLRSVGRHWEILNAPSSSSSEDSSDSASDRKSEEECPSPPRVVEKKIKRRRKRSEVVMDLKDMVVKKRMASLNASAMMAATYSTDKRSSRSDDDSLRKDSDSRESSSTPEVVDVEETSDDEMILGGRKKALVIVNQDTADLTITGVYVNSTTRSTRHEGYCSIAGMQYRISSTSHTQTETAVSTETTVIHTEHGESSRTGGSDGGSSCKTYTPLGALSSMQPPGSPRYPPSPTSSAFSAPSHHHHPHPHHQEMHGYFQPAGPLISSSQLKAGPSQVEEMQGTSSSQAVTYATYPPAPAAYLESPGYPHAYPKYPPPPPGYSHHRRFYYPSLEAPYPHPYPSPHYYNPYTPPPQPPPHYRPGSYMDAQYQPCPCPMQTCPKNVHTGPLTGTSKGSESNSTVPPVGASRGPVQLNPVALALPPEPNAAVNPPSPARGSAGLPPPASPALAQASWGTPPPPQSPGLLTALEPQPKKRRRTTSLSPPPDSDALLEESQDKLMGPIDRIFQNTENYERLSAAPVNRFIPEKALCGRLAEPSETIIHKNNRAIHPSETALQSNIRSVHSSDTMSQSCNRFNHDKISDRLIISSDKLQTPVDRTIQSSEKVISPKNRLIHSSEKVVDRTNHSEKSVQSGRPPHPLDMMPANDRTGLPIDKVLYPNRLLPQTDKIQNSHRVNQSVQSERLAPPSCRPTQPAERTLSKSEKLVHSYDRLSHSERPNLAANRTVQERLSTNERLKPVEMSASLEKSVRSNERLAPVVSDLPNGTSHTDDEDPCGDKIPKTSVNETRRKRSLSRESNVQPAKRRESVVNKRTPRPKKPSSPAEADTPPKRNTKSPERKAKKFFVPLKNGRRRKELEVDEEIVEEMSLVPCPQLKWSNGWSWKGEPFTASVYIRDDRTEVRKCYPAMSHKEGDIIQPRDCILLKSAGSRKNLPFVAKVAALWESPDDGEMMVSLLWYYRPEHTEQGRQPHQPPDEVFASRHKDSNSVACIEDKCYVLTFNEYCRYMKRCRLVDTQSRGWTPVPESDAGYPRGSRMPPGRVSRDLIFFCRKVYDFRLSRILKNPC